MLKDEALKRIEELKKDNYDKDRKIRELEQVNDNLGRLYNDSRRDLIVNLQIHHTNTAASLYYKR